MTRESRWGDPAPNNQRTSQPGRYLVSGTMRSCGHPSCPGSAGQSTTHTKTQQLPRQDRLVWSGSTTKPGQPIRIPPSLFRVLVSRLSPLLGMCQEPDSRERESNVLAELSDRR